MNMTHVGKANSTTETTDDRCEFNFMLNVGRRADSADWPIWAKLAPMIDFGVGQSRLRPVIRPSYRRSAAEKRRLRLCCREPRL